MLNTLLSKSLNNCVEVSNPKILDAPLEILGNAATTLLGALTKAANLLPP